jgi:phosphoadenosine phosphosulfate reductase
MFPGWRQKLLDASIETLRHYEPTDRPYHGRFSGGKDSVLVKELAKSAGVSVVWHYSLTTLDPPELVQFIREHHPDVIIDRPKESFFKLGRRKGIPTRRARWCCSDLKEHRAGKGERLLSGIRAVESPRRAKNWEHFTRHKRTNDYIVSPALLWKDDDVWAFIHGEELPYCSLYNEGFKRLGCIGCPIANKKNRLREFERWPKYEHAWKLLTKHTWNRRTGTKQRDGRDWFGDKYFDGWEEMWQWWLNDESLQSDGCQDNLSLFT